MKRSSKQKRQRREAVDLISPQKKQVVFFNPVLPPEDPQIKKDAEAYRLLQAKWLVATVIGPKS
jgi:hypothetical protein